MSTDHVALSAFELGSLRLANRIALTATVTNLGLNHEITAAQVAFYEERARGGTGLVVTEGLSVHPTSIPAPTVPLAYEPGLVPGLRRLADAVHRHDRPVFGQLWHVGRQGLWNPLRVPWSPSGERDPFSGSTPHVMTAAEIREVIEGYSTSAVNLAKAGFDGVELHGAHGYLLTQFLSPWSNHRTDEWGGSVAGRSRIVVEIVRSIRQACPGDFVVGLKLTGHEYVEGGIDLPAAQEIVDHLVDEVLLDYVAVSPANASPSLEYHVPDLRFDDVPFEMLARGIREAVSGRAPVMAMGKIPDIATADRLVRDGSADLVGMSRALIADPALVHSVEAGRTPRPCIYCNECWHAITIGRPVACVYAPESAPDDAVHDMAKTGPSIGGPLDVQVVGAGPAGLEFARVAGQRGHRVELHEAEQSVGGRVRWESTVPGRESYRKAVAWLEQEVLAAGGVIRCGSHIDLDDPPTDGRLRVVAIGAEPVVAPLPGAANVISLPRALAHAEALPDPIWVVDEIENEPVYTVAEHLAGLGLRVRILTRRESIGRGLAFVSRIGMLRRLDEAGVSVTTLMVPVSAEGELSARHVFSGQVHRLGPVGTIVRAGPYRSRWSGEADGSSTLVIGDASAPRWLMAVVQEASAAANRLPLVGGC